MLKRRKYKGDKDMTLERVTVFHGLTAIYCGKCGELTYSVSGWLDEKEEIWLAYKCKKCGNTWRRILD